MREGVGFDAGVSAVDGGEGESALASLEVAAAVRVLVVGAAAGITWGRLSTGTATAAGDVVVDILGAGWGGALGNAGWFVKGGDTAEAGGGWRRDEVLTGELTRLDNRATRGAMRRLVCGLAGGLLVAKAATAFVAGGASGGAIDGAIVGLGASAFLSGKGMSSPPAVTCQEARLPPRKTRVVTKGFLARCSSRARR